MTTEEMVAWMLFGGSEFEPNPKIFLLLSPYVSNESPKTLAAIAMALDAFSRFGLPEDIAQLRGE